MKPASSRKSWWQAAVGAGRAEEILQRAERGEATTGRSPTGIAAAVIYIAARLQGERVPQQDIGEVAGVTPVTIRNRYKELVDQLNIDL